MADPLPRSVLRATSKKWLGNKYRVEVGSALAEWGEGSVSATALADDTRLRYPRVQEELKRLEDAGLLVELETEGQTVDYKIVPSVYWDCCARILQELESHGADLAR